MARRVVKTQNCIFYTLQALLLPILTSSYQKRNAYGVVLCQNFKLLWAIFFLKICPLSGSRMTFKWLREPFLNQLKICPLSGFSLPFKWLREPFLNQLKMCPLLGSSMPRGARHGRHKKWKHILFNSIYIFHAAIRVQSIGQTD